MATTEATHYFLGHVDARGRVRPAAELEPEPSTPRFWGVRLGRFWPANRPGHRNDPWNEASSIGRDRAAVSLRVAPLLREAEDLEASAAAVFDVHTRTGSDGLFDPVPLDCVLPTKVRAADGVLIQADLVDVSLFLSAEKIAVQAGRVTSEVAGGWQHWNLGAKDPTALFADLGGRLVEHLWRRVIQPTGIDARAWDPRHAKFVLHGPSLDRVPQARAGRYVLAGCWEEHDWSRARYDEGQGLRLAAVGPRVAGNVLEFELLALREVGEGDQSQGAGRST